jgi:hypothetical protein
MIKKKMYLALFLSLFSLLCGGQACAMKRGITDTTEQQENLSFLDLANLPLLDLSRFLQSLKHEAKLFSGYIPELQKEMLPVRFMNYNDEKKILFLMYLNTPQARDYYAEWVCEQPEIRKKAIAFLTLCSVCTQDITNEENVKILYTDAFMLVHFLSTISYQEDPNNECEKTIDLCFIEKKGDAVGVLLLYQLLKSTLSEICLQRNRDGNLFQIHKNRWNKLRNMMHILTEKKEGLPVCVIQEHVHESIVLMVDKINRLTVKSPAWMELFENNLWANAFINLYTIDYRASFALCLSTKAARTYCIRLIKEDPIATLDRLKRFILFLSKQSNNFFFSHYALEGIRFLCSAEIGDIEGIDRESVIKEMVNHSTVHGDVPFLRALERCTCSDECKKRINYLVNMLLTPQFLQNDSALYEQHILYPFKDCSDQE